MPFGGAATFGGPTTKNGFVMDYGGMSHGNQDMGAGLWNAISKAGDD